MLLNIRQIIPILPYPKGWMRSRRRTRLTRARDYLRLLSPAIC